MSVGVGDTSKEGSYIGLASVVIAHSEKVRALLQEAKSFKELQYTKEQRDLLNECSKIPKLDDLTAIQGLAKLSDVALEDWDARLEALCSFARGECEELLDFQEIRIMSMFAMMLMGLKQRSRRHLENFLEACTDGEWVDGLFMGKGPDSEFRTIDRASESARSEFGLGK